MDSFFFFFFCLVVENVLHVVAQESVTYCMQDTDGSFEDCLWLSEIF